jgi:hypothetical protein
MDPIAGPRMDDVLSRPAPHSIGATPTDKDPVVAGAGTHDILTAAAREKVVIVATRQPVVAGAAVDEVALGTPRDHIDPGPSIDCFCAVATGRSVVPRTGLEVIPMGAAIEPVVSGVPGKRIDPRGPAQHVPSGSAHEEVAAGLSIELIRAPVSHQGVEPDAAVYLIVSRPPMKRVVALSSENQIVACVAGVCVVKPRANDLVVTACTPVAGGRNRSR